MSVTATAPSTSSARLVRFAATRPWWCWSLAGVLFLILATAGLPNSPQLPHTPSAWMAEHIGYGVVSCLLLVPAAFPRDDPSLPQRILAASPVALLGVVSYGIYIWHVPMLQLFAHWGALTWIPSSPFVVIVALTVVSASACAALSYLLLEPGLTAQAFGGAGWLTRRLASEVLQSSLT